MRFRDKMLFDLNELPKEEEDGNSNLIIHQPQRSLPIPNPCTSNLFTQTERCESVISNHAFQHVSSSSDFQPFPRDINFQKKNLKEMGEASIANLTSPSAFESCDGPNKAAMLVAIVSQDCQSNEREEGEWSDIQGNAEEVGGTISNRPELLECEAAENVPSSVTIDENNHNESIVSKAHDEKVVHACDLKTNGPSGLESIKSSGCNSWSVTPADGSVNSSMIVKQKERKGIEATRALEFANNRAKRSKMDEHKEALVGTKRSRQTVVVNIEDAKQAGSMKGLTPRRQNSLPTPITTSAIKESTHTNSSVVKRSKEMMLLTQLTTKDKRQSDTIGIESSLYKNSSDQRTELSGEINLGGITNSKEMSSHELASAAYPPSFRGNGSWKQSMDSRQLKGHLSSSRKIPATDQLVADKTSGLRKHPSAKKQTSFRPQYQGRPMERLLREVINDNFWHHQEETELQCVPGHFESVEEYVRVFEPLLFEECRAQLYSTYEELQENVGRDAHISVHVKIVKRQKRGWYDAIVLPVYKCKWNFKDGDVAVLSSTKPGPVKSSRRNSSSANEKHGIVGRVVGKVRQYIPIDPGDPTGAILHFYAADSYDSSSKMDVQHILRKLQPKSNWYLTVLGSLATAQREYAALHAFRYFNLQMQTAILKPSPERFPSYEEQCPAMPDCFTQNFVDYLHTKFNRPQLAAIQCAAVHTAAGTITGAMKRQDPWPFSLVQGPPGTGKTHTVWGMLNVIHLVQYQRYYESLLKKLAPESYNHIADSNSRRVSIGSIDEVLQRMSQSLLRTLPNLCSKPRVLVCAPSNAATDELLTRVLDCGFMDGEMKVYRPDIARVGVESQSQAAQAVSVERRTEQLLMKGRNEVVGRLHQLKAHESLLVQEISVLQRKLKLAATTGHSQGTVGVLPARDHNRDLHLQNLVMAVENRDKVLVEMSRLLIVESKFRARSSFNLEDARASLEKSFADEAEIVFTTVSSSDRKLFSHLTHGFDMVVIDEAAQASEVSVLLPLSRGAAKCVLVGDPQQLPATVISKAAASLLYSRSLFERFLQAGCPTMLLSVQYRMHPQIREFPSRHFYQGRLTDSESVTNLPDEDFYKDPLLQPYMFYDVLHGRESHGGRSVSYQNVHEAQFCLSLYKHLQKFLKANGGKNVSVGIITPYKLQLKCLQRKFKEALNSEEGKEIYINTVDAYQGQERDIIIMSCVRASSHGVGFVADIRRMNVALTRARRALWVVGNANALMQSDDWATLITDAKSRKCFVNMDNVPKEFLVPKDSMSPSGSGGW